MESHLSQGTRKMGHSLQHKVPPLRRSFPSGATCSGRDDNTGGTKCRLWSPMTSAHSGSYFLVSFTRAKGVRLPASSLSMSQFHVSAVLL